MRTPILGFNHYFIGPTFCPQGRVLNGDDVFILLRQRCGRISGSIRFKVHAGAVLGAVYTMTKKWTGKHRGWGQIHSQLEIFFADRLPQ